VCFDVVVLLGDITAQNPSNKFVYVACHCWCAALCWIPMLGALHEMQLPLQGHD
jgi:arginine exporter protein ArgO